VSLRSDVVVISSTILWNTGLCGELVSVGSRGTSYSCLSSDTSPGCDIRGTNLGNACPSPPAPSGIGALVGGADDGVLVVCLMCFVGYLLVVYRPPKKSTEKRKTRTAWTQTVGARMPSAETAMEGTGEVDPMHCAPAAAADDASQADDSNRRGAGEGDGAAVVKVSTAGMGTTSSQRVGRFHPEGIH
jgi:hypothetical protein